MTSGGTRGTALRAWAARRAFRLMPPFLAYRIFHRWFQGLIGCGHAFDERALYGRARIRATMTAVEDSYYALFGTMNFKGMVLARHFVRPGGTIYEIGANVGTETVALAALTGPQGRVVAVEADPRNAAELTLRIRENGLQQVTVVDRAVSDAVRLMVVVRIEMRGGQSYVREGKGDAAVDSVTLDGLAEKYGAPDFLFVDIEGAEFRAYLGGTGMLRDARPPVFSEVSSFLLGRAGSSVDALLDLMRSHCYSAYDTDSRRFPRIDRVGDAEVFGDWLFLPDEREREVPALRRLLLRASLVPRLPLLSPLR